MNSYNYRDRNENQKRKNCDIYSENVLLYKTDVICANKKSILNKKYYELHRNDLLIKKRIYNEKHKNNIKKSNKDIKNILKIL